MEQTAIEPKGTIPLSTTLEPGTYSLETGGGRPRSISEPTPLGDKPDESVAGIMRSELDRQKAEEAKGADKAKAPDDDAEKGKEVEKQAKSEDKDKPARDRTEKGQFSKAVEAEDTEAAPEKAQDERAAPDKGRQSEGRQFSEPPARFLPKARELWPNVPNAVKADLQRITQEDEAEKSQYRESHTRYQQIKNYDDAMRSNGRDLPERLEMFRQVEETLSRDPVAAVDRIFKEAGVRFNVYDFAHHVIQGGQESYQQRSQQYDQQHTQTQAKTEIEKLREELNSMKVQQTAAPIIESFKAQNPRFDELQDDIAFFLESGKIPASLSPGERLATAYDMAERINPRSSVAADDEFDTAPEKRSARPVDPAGRKSIRGAPSDGFDPSTEDDSDTDLTTLLRRELRKQQR